VEMGCDYPSFGVRSMTPLVSLASAGNDVYLEPMGLVAVSSSSSEVLVGADEGDFFGYDDGTAGTEGGFAQGSIQSGDSSIKGDSIAEFAYDNLNNAWVFTIFGSHVVADYTNITFEYELGNTVNFDFSAADNVTETAGYTTFGWNAAPGDDWANPDQSGNVLTVDITFPP